MQNFVILWRVFDARTPRHASRNEAGAAECNRQGSTALSRSGKVVASRLVTPNGLNATCLDGPYQVQHAPFAGGDRAIINASPSRVHLLGAGRELFFLSTMELLKTGRSPDGPQADNSALNTQIEQLQAELARLEMAKNCLEDQGGRSHGPTSSVNVTAVTSCWLRLWC